jgi:hypothetical protein
MGWVAVEVAEEVERGHGKWDLGLRMASGGVVLLL